MPRHGWKYGSLADLDPSLKGSRMSALKLHQPELTVFNGQDNDEGPTIFRIEDYAALRPTRRDTTLRAFDDQEESVDRARILHLNRRCPYCKHPIVDPMALNDGRWNRGHSCVPGTASLVGFQCGGCYQQWPA